ncbi:MAG TPA: hypothetical protein DEF92_03700 [Leclercia adecarboxylata]|nr:hypothetical protein [Leclercia adecarboxylata]
MESAIKRIRANIRSSLKTDFQPSQPVRFVPKADVLMFYNHDTAHLLLYDVHRDSAKWIA